MAVGQAEMRIELLADGADRAVADDRERGVDVHARREAVGRLAFFVHALVEQTDADDFGAPSARHSVPPIQFIKPGAHGVTRPT